MKKQLLLILFISSSLFSQEKNIDRLEVLDANSQEFFKQIISLEKKHKETEEKEEKRKEEFFTTNQFPKRNIQDQPFPIQNKKTKDEIKKEIFEAKKNTSETTTEFLKVKKIEALRVKSLYSFNNKNYVVFTTEDLNKKTEDLKKEISYSIEGRYVVGDFILSHKIIQINRNTKTVVLYKKVENEYSYKVYINNYGTSLSDLQNRKKNGE